MSATLAPTSAPPELAAFLEEARLAVDAELEERLRVVPAGRSESDPLHLGGDDPGRLREAMHYAATGPGKRLRPALVIAAVEACGAPRSHAMAAAAAIEMLHAYTLVHDDLPAMDDDDERRGRPTVHKVFGEAVRGQVQVVRPACRGELELSTRGVQPRHDDIGIVFERHFDGPLKLQRLRTGRNADAKRQGGGWRLSGLQRAEPTAGRARIEQQ